MLNPCKTAEVALALKEKKKYLRNETLKLGCKSIKTSIKTDSNWQYWKENTLGAEEQQGRRGGLEMSLRVSPEESDSTKDSNGDTWKDNKPWCHSTLGPSNLLHVLHYCWEASRSELEPCTLLCKLLYRHAADSLCPEELRITGMTRCNTPMKQRKIKRSLPTVPPTGHGLGRMEAADEEAVPWEAFFSSHRRILINVTTHR